MDKTKHLEFIQAVIARMANNSFLIRGWSVTLAAALLALSSNGNRRELIVVALFPALAFWGLDAYYLREERLFRQLYDHVRSQNDDNWSADQFSMSTVNFRTHVPTNMETLFSPTILILHGIIVLIVLAVTLAVTL